MVDDRLNHYTTCNGDMGTFALLELAGRLDLAVDAIRLANGTHD